MPLTRDTKSWQLLPMTCPECKFHIATVVHSVVQEPENRHLHYETAISCGHSDCDFNALGKSRVSHKGGTPEEAMIEAWWRYQR